MKRFISLCVATVTLLATMAATSSAEDNNDIKLLSKFESLKAKFDRKYKNVAEEEQRFANYKANVLDAQVQQSRNPKATFSADHKFFDVSREEFKATHHNLKIGDGAKRRARLDAITPESKRAVSTKYTTETMPKVFTWLNHNPRVVGHIRNQAQCGSCWAFSTVDTIETSWALAGNQFIGLSEENIVECDHTDDGCGGGDPGTAFAWLAQSQNGWLSSEKSYPYTSGDGYTGSCKHNLIDKAAHVSGHADVSHNEEKMAAYLAEHGQLSICVAAASWMNYESGVLTDCYHSSVDHCVGLVAYNLSAPTKYWQVRNSWGTSWGQEGGYLFVEFDKCCFQLCTEPRLAKVKSGPVPPPGPPTPSPPTAPPTPSPPTPKGKNFIQMDCSNSQCSSGCQNHTFPADKCLPLNGGGSAKAHCEATELVMTEYPISSDCSGFSIPSTMPLNQCLQNGDGQGYFENFCTPALSATAGLNVLSSRPKRV